MEFEIKKKVKIKPHYEIHYGNDVYEFFDINTVSVKNLLIVFQMMNNNFIKRPADIANCPICIIFFQRNKGQNRSLIEKIKEVSNKYNPEGISIKYLPNAKPDLYYVDKYNTPYDVEINFNEEDSLNINNYKASYNIAYELGSTTEGFEMACKFLDLEEGKLKQMLRSDNKEIFNLGLDLLKIN
jgi:hypothetical protein